MRILFVLKGFALVRHFEEVVRHLAEKGHTVILAEAKRKVRRQNIPDSVARLPACSAIQASVGEPDGRRLALDLLRMTRDYLRYHEPAFWSASTNRKRAQMRLLRTISSEAADLSSNSPEELPEELYRLDEPTTTRLRQAFLALEAAFPADAGYCRFIQEQEPDLVLVTPLVNLGGRQAEFVKAARALSVPCGLPVFSWDNLSNKGVIHQAPDRVFVWNEVQRREAVELHGIPDNAVVVTGAPRFDEFFRMSPSSERSTFCEMHGLDPGRRLLVYLASSPQVSPREPDFVDSWVAALRGASDLSLREAQVLVRPHPRAKEIWRRHPRYGAGSTAGAGIALAMSKSVQSDQSLYDALVHADAAVGLNTTAEIEAAILGTPTYTVHVPAAAPGQSGSLHFSYLLDDNGGCVVAAETMGEHLRQLAQGLAGRMDRHRQQRFVEQFVRPRGIAVPASPILADEIIALGQTGRLGIQGGG